jgi:hypothetical protein
MLKRLLIVDQPDCLTGNYQELINSFNLKKMKDEEYIRIVPRFDFENHENLKSIVLLEFDDFVGTDNPQYRDCTISFTIISHLDT